MIKIYADSTTDTGKAEMTVNGGKQMYDEIVYGFSLMLATAKGQLDEEMFGSLMVLLKNGINLVMDNPDALDILIGKG